ncbi:hypothetical protein R4Z10_20555 [Niallia sp. XMNu-256]|uniref:hypothetical protein n=1 Tax=Niallia sp. XMNu-256 TaxID=3082444 RepID=UPI0030D4A93D
MARLISVEFRKLFRRKEFYVSLVTLALIGVFIVYQLATGGGLVNIQQEGNNLIPISELIIGVVGIFNMLGITAIIACISVWNILGAELDQRILSTYFLNSPSRVKVIFSKLIVSFANMVMIIVTFALFMIISCMIFTPENITIVGKTSEVLNILIACASFISLALIFILLSFNLALLFGNIGVIFGTIGLSLLSSLLNAYGVIDEWLPLTITDFNRNFQYQDLMILFIYIIGLLLICIPLVRFKEVKS